MRDLKIIGLLVASLCFLFASEVKSQNTDYKRPPQEMVPLTNVVYSGIGEFKMVDKKLWTNTKTKQRFKETHRDPWSIFLVEEKGGKKIFLDLYQGKVRPEIAVIKSSNVLWAPLLNNYKNVSACGSYPKPKQEDVSSISYMEAKTGSNNKVVFEQTSADVWKVGNAKLKERERRVWSIFLRKTIAVGTLDYRFDLHKGQVFMSVDNGKEFLVGCMAKATKDNKGNTGNFEPMTFSEKDISNRSVLGSRIPALDNFEPPSTEDQRSGYNRDDMDNHRNLNVNGLGRCYDIRKIDVVNWTKETLESGKAQYVFDLDPDTNGETINAAGDNKILPKNTTFTSLGSTAINESSELIVTGSEFQKTFGEKYSAEIGVAGIVSANASAAFEKTTGGSKEKENLYVYNSAFKQMYKVELDNYDKHLVRSNFHYGVHQLGYSMSANDFIKKFGTHFASGTTFGGNYMYRETVTKTAFSNYLGTKEEFTADIEGTFKAITGSVGTEQTAESKSRNYSSSMFTKRKYFTVGGNIDQKDPKNWLNTVTDNPVVVSAQLTSLANLLTKDNFPDVENIDNKRKLLEVAINKAIKEAKRKVSSPSSHDFFKPTPMTFKLETLVLECNSDGDVHSKGDFYGSVLMGFFNREGKQISGYKLLSDTSDDGDDYEMEGGENHTFRHELICKVNKEDIRKGYVQLWGWMKEDDDTSNDNMGSYNQALKNHGAINYQGLMSVGDSEKGQLSWEYVDDNDKVTFHYKLTRIE